MLLFFDVKPVSVKAYGGARYTSEKRLVLPLRQKTRGLFYLFTTYEVNTGRVHWGYHSRKDSSCVCQFMQRIRGWYPRNGVWVVGDHDSAHPCRSKQTRHVVRQLGLHWRTLPKGSPDDNPVETIFSIIQQEILALSNDPDASATQRRISGYLRGYNRRRDRKIHIAYLDNSDRKQVTNSHTN